MSSHDTITLYRGDERRKSISFCNLKYVSNQHLVILPEKIYTSKNKTKHKTPLNNAMKYRLNYYNEYLGGISLKCINTTRERIIQINCQKIILLL